MEHPHDLEIFVGIFSWNKPKWTRLSLAIFSAYIQLLSNNLICKGRQ